MPTDQDGAKGEGEEKGGENKKKKGKSQYLIDREKNIKKNRELLTPFFKEINDALVEWKEEEQATKKKKKEGKKTTKVEKEKEIDKPIKWSTWKSKE